MKQIESIVDEGLVVWWTSERRNWITIYIYSGLEQYHNNLFYKTKISKTHENGKFRLCGSRKETLNNIISEYKKLV